MWCPFMMHQPLGPAVKDGRALLCPADRNWDASEEAQFAGLSEVRAGKQNGAKVECPDVLVLLRSVTLNIYYIFF